MAPFDRETNPDADRAFELLIGSPVTLYRRTAVLDETTDWLAEHGYHLVPVDAASARDERDLLDSIGLALDFPAYYGANLDALNDCLRDVIDHEYGWPADATGLVIVFTGYDAAIARWPRAAHIVLDIIAEHSRVAAMFGDRMLCLVQSEDPDLWIEPVGKNPVMWNPAEVLINDRQD